MDPDVETIDRFLAGEEQAFSELLERHKTVIYSIAYRMVGNSAEAEDIAQESFVKAYTTLGDFRRECSFRNWLARIATRLSIDHLRAGRKEKETASNLDVQEVPTSGPEEGIVSHDQLMIALGKIPESYRAAVILRHLEGLSYQEMAEILQLPLGTVKTHLRRGRAALKAEMEKFHAEEAQIYRRVEEI